MILLKKILFLLSKKERKYAVGLTILMIVSAGAEVLGVASIAPFMTLLVDPDIIIKAEHIGKVAHLFGLNNVESITNFQVVFGMLVFCLYLVAISLRAALTYFQMRFVTSCEQGIASRLMQLYLNQPYEWFLNNHSSDMGRSILSEVGGVISHGLLPMVMFCTHGILAFCLTVFLLLIDPPITLLIAGVVGGAYGLIYLVTKSYLVYLGERKVHANKLRFSAIFSAFLMIKEVKFRRLEDVWCENFSMPAKEHAMIQSRAHAFGQMPRYLIEAVGFGGMIMVTLILIARGNDVSEFLPTLAIYAFAGYRLLPALQHTFNSLTQLKFSSSILSTLYNDFSTLTPLVETRATSSKKISFDYICLNNVSYSYPNSDRLALDDISMQIRRGDRIGIVGKSGAGKSTLVDVILGLLSIKQGSLYIDGQNLESIDTGMWRSMIGYVPQHIVLLDDSLRTNIAMDFTNIDDSRVEWAARLAGLHDFVSNTLPFGYHTLVGENGVKFSGGERQRVGIARALYHSPSILILDEATSALDSETEHNVMKSIEELEKSTTIILIAHRLSTVKKCDRIYVLDKGKLRCSGSYERLKENDEVFSKMVALQ